MAMRETIPFNVALIVPTGIGASIGGFGGDAMTLLPLLASICDRVVTHPNVANAACFQMLPDNALYVEGYALDRFFLGEWALQPVRQNRVGVIWDSGIPADMEILHRNSIAAVRTVYGVDVVGIARTETPVASSLLMGESGRSSGRLEQPEVLLNAGQSLLEQGATALAVCCLMPEAAEEPEQTAAYRQGDGVDPIGGLEAMISHLLVAAFQRPTAHAPVFPYEKSLPVTDAPVDPRAASEFIVSTFLPCVLTGLARAPRYRSVRCSGPDCLTIDSLSALVVPGDALGGIPVLAAIERDIPVLAVQNNRTVMQCSQKQLGLADKVISCANPIEALGHLIALRQGIAIPAHFRSAP